MSERLYIRLGTAADHPCDWLVWSEQEQEIIASGRLQNAAELSTLQQRAANRPVDVLVSSQAISVNQITLPEQGQRQAMKALPFMLEEQIVDDVENMHFITGRRHGDLLTVLAVPHAQMQLWLSWLQDAELKARVMLPDVFALPLTEQTWSAMQVDQQCLIHTQTGMGYQLPIAWLEVALPKLLAAEESPVSVASFTPLTLANCQMQQQTLELPLLVLAKGSKTAIENLLIGAYKPRKEIGKHLKIWRNSAIAASIVAVLGLAHNGLSIYKMEQQSALLKAESERIYKQAIPNSQRIVNLRSQMNRELSQLQGKGGGDQLFKMLDVLAPNFKEISTLKPDSIRFDGKRNELRMQVTAASYAEIEKFTELAKASFEVETGTMNSRDEQVSSTLTLRSF